MSEQERKMFEETVNSMKQLDRDGLLIVNASAKTLLMVQQAENIRKNIPAA